MSAHSTEDPSETHNRRAAVPPQGGRRRDRRIAPRARPHEVLVEFLWQGSEPKVGRHRLCQALYSLRRQLEPPGVAKPDWWIFARIARAMGFHGFDFQNADAVWDEYRLVTKGTLCDQRGMTNQRLRQGPLQWPSPHEKHPGTPRRSTDWKFPTSSGKAKFWCRSHQPPAETPDEEFPFVLTTGRIASQWHTRTRTGKIPELVRHAPEPFVEMHPQDAERLGITDDDLVSIESRRGRAQARVKVTKDIRPGLVFAPFHWGDLWSENSAVNDATNPAFDPISQQPELKYCAVRVQVGGAKHCASDLASPTHNASPLQKSPLLEGATA